INNQNYKETFTSDLCLLVHVFTQRPPPFSLRLSSSVIGISFQLATKKKQEMSSSDEVVEDMNVDGDSSGTLKLRFKDRSEKVAKTKEMLSKQAVQTKEMLSKQAVKIAKQAEEHERFINKVTHLLGVLGFGGFCFLLGASE
ncbi:hypothetical protein QQP08_024861, partial [Theobroma cacao]